MQVDSDEDQKCDKHPQEPGLYVVQDSGRGVAHMCVNCMRAWLDELPQD